MKRLVFCFDGTWNRLDAKFPTNVVLTAESVLPHAESISQVIFYDEGVGTGRGERILGGAFGAGLTRNLGDAYRFLIFNYTPGDQIFVFGFSRGAFTARSFVGLILCCGVLDRRSAANVSEVIEAYRDRPLVGESLEFMRQRLGKIFSPSVCVSETDRNWRCENVESFSSDSCIIDVRFLGVWDTVGALGMPQSFSISSLINRKYRFHDTRLSPRVQFARHAVAIDERRKAFAPTLWDNVEQLNSARGKLSSDADAPYQEVWFPGTHGSVGGGGIVRGLSDQALDWVWDGARLAGLRLDTSKSSRIYELSPALGVDLDNRGATKSLLGRFLHSFNKRSLLPEQNRDPGPSALHEVSITAQRRWLDEPSYRPSTLSRVAADIEGQRRLFAEVRETSRNAPFTVYEVRPGDSLRGIAKHLLGDADRYTEIVSMNLGKVIDPNRIYVGQTLKIPSEIAAEAAR